MIKVRTNPDREFVKEMAARIKANNKYCPCAVTKSEDTKCQCKEFREMLANGETGYCHCGLYEAYEEDPNGV